MKWGFAQKWALSQGMLGDSKSLAPSAAALGPNVYLTQRDFFKMLAIALLVHLGIFLAAGLIPRPKVVTIPVRALSFKLGDQDRIAAYSPTTTAASPGIAAPVMRASNDARITPQAPRPVKPQKNETIQQVRAPLPPPPMLQPLPLAPLPQPPAIAPEPQQFIREVGQPTPPALAQLPSAPAGAPEGAIGGTGTVSTQTAETSKEIRDRYEQQISSWIERHKLYPAEAGGRAGRVVVRMRIDRGGTVRYYALEESSGVAAIDAAALDMIRRANPVPAAPVNYPAGTLIEFLIPISFQAPQ